MFPSPQGVLRTKQQGGRDGESDRVLTPQSPHPVPLAHLECSAGSWGPFPRGPGNRHRGVEPGGDRAQPSLGREDRGLARVTLSRARWALTWNPNSHSRTCHLVSDCGEKILHIHHHHSNIPWAPLVLRPGYMPHHKITRVSSTGLSPRATPEGHTQDGH